MPLSYRHFFNASNDLMCVLDLEGVIRFANEKWFEILGYDPKDAIGKPISEFLHPEEKMSSAEMMQVLLKADSASKVSNRYVKANNKYQWISWTSSYDQEDELLYCVGEDVSDYKRLQATLDALEESTGVGVWTLDPKTGEIYWSSKVYDIHDTTPDEYEPILETAVKFYPPEAMPILNENLALMAEGHRTKFELPLITAKGERIWVESKLFADIRDGVVIQQYGTFQNITEKRKETIENRKLKQRVDLAFKASNIGVWEFDIASETLTWDEQMFEIYDVDKSMFKNTFADWENTVFPEDLQHARKGFEQALNSDEVFSNQFRIVTKSHGIRYISAIGKVTKDANGQATFVTGINWDVTAQEESRKELLEAKEKAEAADVAKSTFLANMSHEIRTPLNGIYGALQLLGSREDIQTRSKLIGTALNATQGLTRIINDILDFSKIQANKLELERIPVDIEQLIKEVFDQQSLLERANKVSKRILISPEAKGLWLTDPLRLKQILINIVSNAYKFTLEGEISIELSLEYQRPQITITDTGLGMSEKEINQLFNPFVQADDSTSRKFGGTGLGLTITKSLVELFEGTISVESTVGCGSSFTLLFPFEKAEAEGSFDTVNNENIELPDLNGKLMFIAEDNQMNQEIIAEMLKPTGVQYILFPNGNALLEGYNKRKPDMIFCDIQMPVMDGTAACAAIRENDTKTPIVAYTANVMRADIEQYSMIGFDDVLAKPTLLTELAQILRKYLV